MEDLEFIGHMSAAQQRTAWDSGEIDAGFMWGGNMRYLQDNPWCSKADPTSPNYRACAQEGKGRTGYNLFTAGMSTTWGRETWNNLVVRDACAAKYPKAVSRVVKVISMMDTKVVQDKGFFVNNDTRLCSIAVSIANKCDEMSLNDNGQLVLEEELDEMLQQIKTQVAQKVDEIYSELEYDIQPLSSEDSYIYRILERNPESELDMKYLNKFGYMEFGRTRWNKLSVEKKKIQIKKLMSDWDMDSTLTITGFKGYY